VRESRSPVTTEEMGKSLLRKIDDPRIIHGIEGQCGKRRGTLTKKPITIDRPANNDCADECPGKYA
jgi:hypothetical protein